MIEKLMKKNIVLFWHHEDLVEHISDSISITHIHPRYGMLATIQFECRVQGHSFFLQPRGYIEARYVLVGDASNPYTGDLICTINDLKYISFGVAGFTQFKPSKDEILFTLRVEASVIWNIFEENDGDEISA